MIEFKILSAPDKFQVGNYQHHSRELVFGRQSGDMILDDPHVSDRHLRIYFEGEQAFAENLDPSQPIRLNGKNLDEPTPTKAKDNFVLGKITISLLRVDAQVPEPPESFDNPKIRSRFIPGTKEEAILAVIDHLAKNQSSPPKPPTPGSAAKPPIPPPFRKA